MALKDLTGFEGRIDAIYFSKKSAPKLPNTSAEVVGWKNKLSGRSQDKVHSTDFELVVVGGGMSGCAAALAAAEKGMKEYILTPPPSQIQHALKRIDIIQIFFLQ